MIQTERVLITESSAFILTELVGGGDLFSYIYSGNFHGADRRADTEQQLAWIVFQILQALKYLHSYGIVHRDLKLENILVGDVNPITRIVVTDFGMARQVVSRNTTEQPRMHSFCGTTTYQAPEILSLFREALRGSKDSESSGYGPEVDLWQVPGSID